MVHDARSLDAGEPERPKPKRKMEYQFNSSTDRWEPMPVEKSSRPLPEAAATRGRGAAAAPAASASRLPPRHAPQPAVADPRRRVDALAEVQTQAREDAAKGLCDHSQALVVRLALSMESRPRDILSTMKRAGLPAAKDQRSTVKAIMRLCHPDKCKHPEAKKAMQILQPLLIA